MTTEIFQINLLDWFAIWGAILVALLLLMWFSREPREEAEQAERAFGEMYDLERAEEAPARRTRRCPPAAF